MGVPRSRVVFWGRIHRALKRDGVVSKRGTACLMTPPSGPPPRRVLAAVSIWPPRETTQTHPLCVYFQSRLVSTIVSVLRGSCAALGPCSGAARALHWRSSGVALAQLRRRRSGPRPGAYGNSCRNDPDRNAEDRGTEFNNTRICSAHLEARPQPSSRRSASTRTGCVRRTASTRGVLPPTGPAPHRSDHGGGQMGGASWGVANPPVGHAAEPPPR